MKRKTRNGILFAGSLIGAGITTAVASAMLYRETLPRPAGTSQDIIDEFADPAKFAEYEKLMRPNAEWLEAQNLEDVRVRADDGILLHGYYLKAEKPCGKLVMFHHGFTSKALDNGNHAKFFHDLGYEVLLLDLRAHGESEGNYVGFGILDRFDTSRWVSYVRKRFGDAMKIVLHGTSMGAATVLMALGLPEIQENVSAVIADCAYTSPAAIFSHVMKKNYHVPVTAPIIRLNGIYSRAKAGYAFSDYSTLTALEHNRVPVLFIHGKEDLFVPVWMSEQNYDACTAMKKLLLVDHAGHGSSLFENPELYERTEAEFLAEVFRDREKDSEKEKEKMTDEGTQC